MSMVLALLNLNVEEAYDGEALPPISSSCPTVLPLLKGDVLPPRLGGGPA